MTELINRAGFLPKPYLLHNEIQHYKWGTKNDKAFIPQFSGINTEKDRPYAELWMGAHPKAPSKIEIDGEQYLLNRLIENYPVEILGEAVARKFDNKLPFLFKVLSANEALSIQAHPNKQQAAVLHTRDAEHYPDDNHKPEIAIALDKLLALAGFRPIPTLITVFERYPEIAAFIGEDICADMKKVRADSVEANELVKRMFSSLMHKSQTNKGELLAAIESLTNRLREKAELTEREKIFFELRKIYPGADSGLFSLFLLNLIRLKKGEAIFLNAGIPHAYLQGNIVECMANSDNVVRAGLTPKFQDVKTLVDILTYDTAPIAIQVASRSKYDTPVPEFAIEQIKLGAEAVETVETKSIQFLLITDGEILIEWGNEAVNFQKGQAVLIPASLKRYRLKSSRKANLFMVEVP